MIVLVDGNNNKIFLEDIDFSRPPLDSVMSIERSGSDLMLNKVYIRHLRMTGSFRASIGLGLDVRRENQKVVKI